MGRRVPVLGFVLAASLTLGAQPQGCENEGEVAEPFRYLTRQEGYRPPLPGEVTLYQTNGPVGGGSVQTVAESPQGDVYAGTFGNGIYTRAAGSDRWRASERGPKDRFLMSLLALPDGVMLAGGIHGGIFRSEDRGRSWIQSSEGLTNTQVSTILRDEQSGTLYAGTGAGVFKSVDAGRHWTASNRGLEMVLSRSLAVARDGTLYTGTGGSGLFLSRDRGTTWRPFNEGLRDERGLTENFIRVLAMGPAGTLYAGSFGGGVFKTVRDGWTPVNEGLTNLSIRALIIGESVMYAGTGEGVFQTSDGGAHWVSVNGMPDVNVQSLLLGGDGTLYAGTGSGVLERPRNGAWRVSDRGMLFPVILAVLADQQRGLFAGTRGAGLFRSKDAGETWVPFNDGIGSRTIRALARDRRGTLYAATDQVVYRADWEVSRWVSVGDGLEGEPVALVAGPGRLYVATSHGIFESDAAGPGWSPVQLGESRSTVTALTSDRLGAVYAESDGRIWRRGPSAEPWDVVPSPPFPGVLGGLAAGKALYAWSPSAIFAAVPVKKAWQWRDIGAKLPKELEIAGVAVEANEDRDVVFAATSGGVWWSANDGAQWRLAQGEMVGRPFHTVLTTEERMIVAGSEEDGVFVGVNLVPRQRRFGLF